LDCPKPLKQKTGQNNKLTLRAIQARQEDTASCFSTPELKHDFHHIMSLTSHCITITEEPIRLGQFLKLANLVQDGLEAKILIQNGKISVNGSMEIRRGRKLTHGDQVMMGNTLYLIQCTKHL
jgi:ribosome-associated protein